MEPLASVHWLLELCETGGRLAVGCRMSATDLCFMSFVGNCKFKYFAAQMTTHEAA